MALKQRDQGDSRQNGGNAVQYPEYGNQVLGEAGLTVGQAVDQLRTHAAALGLALARGCG